mmetsp:Transcript_16283/g.36619  ORF Transcript_16283/g.36619 Transcript_16283/m.36619 type:complete len:298 (-) Transcript_16283:136-1029(-)
MPFLPDKILNSRSVVILLLHAYPIFPLCLRKSLNDIRYSSMVGLFSILYTVIFLALRRFDGSYEAGGKFSTMTSSSGLFGPAIFGVGSGGLPNIRMCCVAFVCHYNVIKTYGELEDRSVTRFSRVAAVGTAVTVAIYLGAMLLVNDHRCCAVKDPLAVIARFAIGAAAMAGYPHLFSGLKSAVFSIRGLNMDLLEAGKHAETNRSLMTGVLLVALAVGACHLGEQGSIGELAKVAGIIASVSGSAIAFILPAVFNLSVFVREGANFSERISSYLLLVLGVSLAALGTWVSLVGDGFS